MVCTKCTISGRVACVVPINISHGTGEANVVEGQSYHAPSLPQLQVTGGPQQSVKRNRNAEHRQCHHACRQQMEEARKAICPIYTGREVQPSVSSERHQTREVCVWIPKDRAHEAHVSKALSCRRDVQQCEVCVFSQRYETCVSMSKREAHEVRVSQMSPGKRDN